MHVLVTSFQNSLFMGSYADDFSAKLLDVGVALYDVVQPDFGWADLCEPAGYTWFNHVDALAVPHLYWANFLGPNYVQKIGADVLLSLPMWHVRQLRDRGFLCVLSPAIYLRDPRLSTHEMAKRMNPDAEP
jgi:hypothetical protein